MRCDAQDDQSIWTVLQKVRIQKGTSTTPDAAKQGSAFPPNYIHSLDSTHMMMTALACKDAGKRPLTPCHLPLLCKPAVTSPSNKIYRQWQMGFDLTCAPECIRCQPSLHKTIIEQCRAHTICLQ